MGETLGMVNPEATFLSICVPVKPTKQVICLQNTMVGHTKDRHYHSKVGNM